MGGRGNVFQVISQAHASLCDRQRCRVKQPRFPWTAVPQVGRVHADAGAASRVIRTLLPLSGFGEHHKHS